MSLYLIWGVFSIFYELFSQLPKCEHVNICWFSLFVDRSDTQTPTEDELLWFSLLSLQWAGRRRGLNHQTCSWATVKLRLQEFVMSLFWSLRPKNPSNNLENYKLWKKSSSLITVPFQIRKNKGKRKEGIMGSQAQLRSLHQRNHTKKISFVHFGL